MIVSTLIITVKSDIFTDVEKSMEIFLGNYFILTYDKNQGQEKYDDKTYQTGLVIELANLYSAKIDHFTVVLAMLN